MGRFTQALYCSGLYRRRILDCFFRPPVLAAKESAVETESRIAARLIERIRQRELPQQYSRWAFCCPQEGTSVLSQSRLFKRSEHLLAVGLEFQFPGEGTQL